MVTRREWERGSVQCCERKEQAARLTHERPSRLPQQVLMRTESPVPLIDALISAKSFAMTLAFLAYACYNLSKSFTIICSNRR